MQKLISFGLICLAALLWANASVAQELSNLRQRKILLTADTVQIDTLSIIPASFELFNGEDLIDSANYEILEVAGLLRWKGGDYPDDSLTCNYRTFPVSFLRPIFHKSAAEIENAVTIAENPFVYRPEDLRKQENIFSSGGLEKSGSITRGVGFGNNQDLNVNSGLNLSLSGKLTDQINILASVTDNNIPIQPEGNTAQLQDFDQVFIQLFDDQNKLIVGDFQLRRPSSGYFMNYFKRAQGASFETRQLFNGNKPPSENNNLAYLQASAAISKGKWARNQILGQEGNQGPYRLRGADGEEFIIILAGTENVYIDGRLLQRGQENDYIIDYNSAEIVFTPNQLITKDRRITVEFQYSERNYSRTMLQLASGIRSEKFDAYLNVYSEQDSKNQPLQQDISQAERQFLAEIGNDIQNAVVPAIDSVAFTNDQVLYLLKDSLGYDSVFVYSTNPDSARYRLSFSNVGQGNGDYIQGGFAASGRLFVWVAPDTIGGQIIRNGSFSPVILLVTPKQQQMISAGGRWKIAEETSLGIELALSNNDLNTFSTAGNDQNTGAAARVIWENRNNLQPEKKQPLYFNTTARYELVEARFEAIERFRGVEFTRDWNVQQFQLETNQHEATAGLGIEKRGVFSLNYNLSSFVLSEVFEGIRNELIAAADYKSWFLDFRGSILSGSAADQSEFQRHKTLAIKKFKWFNLGYKDEREKNTFRSTTGDTLRSNSYQFHEWEVYVGNPDTTTLEYKVFYSQRKDRRGFQNELSGAEQATHYGLEMGYNKDPRHQFRARLVNRQMNVLNAETAISQPENTLLGNISYDLRIFKGALSMNLYYEVGSGLERAREFIYVFDPTGQGPYTWIDYNENGVQELNEFEIARPEDGNRYLRIWTPTDNYIRALTNQYSHTVNWNPMVLWANEKGVLKLLSRISNQLAYRVDRKTTGEEGIDRFNPFNTNQSDTALITANSSVRNTLFFNRSHAKYGVDYTYGQNTGKSLLTNGFDSRDNRLNELKARYNASRTIGLVARAEEGVRSNISDFLDGRNYRINYYTLEPSVSYQPNTSFRGTLKFRYTEKDNEPDLGGEKAILQDVGIELRYNQVSKGSLLGNLNFVNIRYGGVNNTSLAYEMLEGLRSGQNFTWSVSYQRSLGKNVQLNLTYNGRKSEEINAVHSGGVQLRAFF